MTDINAVIARFKGWANKRELQGLSIERDIWVSPNEFLSAPTPSDYLHDANLYMVLFEEMKNSGFEFRLESDTTGRGEAIYTATFLEQRNDTKGTGWNMKVISTQSTIGGAICLAYCKLHGLECEE